MKWERERGRGRKFEYNTNEERERMYAEIHFMFAIQKIKYFYSISNAALL